MNNIVVNMLNTVYTLSSMLDDIEYVSVDVDFEEHLYDFEGIPIYVTCINRDSVSKLREAYDSKHNSVDIYLVYSEEPKSTIIYDRRFREEVFKCDSKASEITRYASLLRVQLGVEGFKSLYNCLKHHRETFNTVLARMYYQPRYGRVNSGKLGFGDFTAIVNDSHYRTEAEEVWVEQGRNYLFVKGPVVGINWHPALEFDDKNGKYLLYSRKLIESLLDIDCVETVLECYCIISKLKPQADRSMGYTGLKRMMYYNLTYPNTLLSVIGELCN